MELMQSLEATDKSLGGQVKRFFRSVCNLLKRTIRAYSNVKPDSTEGRLVQEMQDLYDQLQQVFAEGLYEGGDNYRKADNSIEIRNEIAYSKRRNRGSFFKENVFPPYNESHSEAHELAERWAKSDNTETGECKLISFHNQWYLIEAFEDLKYGYQIMKKLTKQEYIKEAKFYGTITGFQSLQDTSSENAALLRAVHQTTRRRHSPDFDASEYGGSNYSLYGMDTTQNSGGDLKATPQEICRAAVWIHKGKSDLP